MQSDGCRATVGPAPNLFVVYPCPTLCPFLRCLLPSSELQLPQPISPILPPLQPHPLAPFFRLSSPLTALSTPLPVSPALRRHSPCPSLLAPWVAPVSVPRRSRNESGDFWRKGPDKHREATIFHHFHRIFWGDRNEAAPGTRGVGAQVGGEGERGKAMGEQQEQEVMQEKWGQKPHERCARPVEKSCGGDHCRALPPPLAPLFSVSWFQHV